ncbi:MAG: peptide chain release factor N(5)-glutamine methyltransferase, partial [Natronospirillum sp.]|uniref:peptide chain release factor N(5)-glutamine methyltransferase n=1 Tax=Natronospirillum sp. TaxID=2812955 RepID=UPI0025FA31E5
MTGPETVSAARQSGQAILRDAGLPADTVAVDTDYLLCHVLQRTRTWLMTWPEAPLSEDQQSEFKDLLQRRAGGEPVAHITGTCGFWTLQLTVDASTLIPRPDTETLVEATLELLGERRQHPLYLADLGTGTGAIALALASECPDWRVIGIDAVPEAVQLAKRNAERNGLQRVPFLLGDWAEPLADHSLDVLVSNPPYIRADDPHLEQGDVRFEPRSALVAGADGLTDLRLIIQQGVRVLRAGGWLLLEHGHDQ